jgi:hypothetical protein
MHHSLPVPPSQSTHFCIILLNHTHTQDICEAVNVASTIKNPYRTILRRRYWPQLSITMLIPIFQQLTGINAIM